MECWICKQDKPESCFSRYNKIKCRPCLHRNQTIKVWAGNRAFAKIVAYLLAGHKFCSRCKLYKKLGDFGRDNRRSHGRIVYCRMCMKDYVTTQRADPVVRNAHNASAHASQCRHRGKIRERVNAKLQHERDNLDDEYVKTLIVHNMRQEGRPVLRRDVEVETVLFGLTKARVKLLRGLRK